MKKNYRFAITAALLLLLLTAGITIASTIIARSFDQVALESELIFEGRVLSKETRPSTINDMPYTYFTCEIIDVIKGFHEAPTIEIGYLGGQSGDFTLSVSDMRIPEIDERGIYFVETLAEQQVHPLYGWHQGHYLIVNDHESGLEVVIAEGQEPFETDSSELNLVPTLEDFKQKIRKLLDGSHEFQKSQEPLIKSESSPYSLIGASWPNAEATVYSTGGSSNSTFDNAFVEAMNNWNNLSNFSFNDASGLADPCANPNNYGPPWLTGYAFRSDSCGNAFGSSTLAVNYGWTSGGEIIQAGMVFNTAWSWDVHSLSGSNIDFRRVATHELGHALGLGHDNAYSALMNTIYSETIETPQTDDINGLRAIYGGTGTGTTSTQVALKTDDGHYLTALQGGGDNVVAYWTGVGAWETFELVDLGNNNVALKTNDGHYVTALWGGGRNIVAYWTGIGDWETFEKVDLGNNQIALKTFDGHYLSALKGGGDNIVANWYGVGAWEIFEIVFQ